MAWGSAKLPNLDFVKNLGIWSSAEAPRSLITSISSTVSKIWSSAKPQNPDFVDSVEDLELREASEPPFRRQFRGFRAPPGELGNPKIPKIAKSPNTAVPTYVDICIYICDLVCLLGRFSSDGCRGLPRSSLCRVPPRKRSCNEIPSCVAMQVIQRRLKDIGDRRTRLHLLLPQSTAHVEATCHGGCARAASTCH